MRKRGIARSVGRRFPAGPCVPLEVVRVNVCHGPSTVFVQMRTEEQHHLPGQDCILELSPLAVVGFMSMLRDATLASVELAETLGEDERRGS